MRNTAGNHTGCRAGGATATAGRDFGDDPLSPFATVAALSPDDVGGLSSATLRHYAVLTISRCFCGERLYGRTGDDFAAATAFFIKPGRSFPDLRGEARRNTKARLLCFNPAQCQGDTIQMGRYSFFDYSADEALHLSAGELAQLNALLDGIMEEQRHDIDRDSSDIMAHHVMLTLDYCRRFYTRQFIVRTDSSRAAIGALHSIIRAYYSERQNAACAATPPKAQAIARQMGMSEQYLEDLTTHETGLSVAQHVNLQRFDMAREWLLHTGMSAALIARRLGFKSPECLNSVFEKSMGCRPEQCRSVC